WRLRRAQLGRNRYPLPHRHWPAKPVQLGDAHPGFGERALRPDDNPAAMRFQAQDVERLGGGDAEPLALADREMGDTAMLPQHLAAAVDDLAGLAGLRAQTLDQRGIGALRDKADVLAVRLRRNGQREF